jgi:cobalt ECF transporter T component CbiQ
MASRVETPAWLLATEPATSPCGCIGRPRKASFLEKTLGDSTELFRHAMYAELPEGHGRLWRVDPRIKMACLLALLVAIALVHNPLTLLTAYAALVAAASVGGIPLRPFLRRVWLVIPLFTAIAVAPATLSVVTPGDLIVQLWTWHGTPHGLTRQGLLTAALVILRVACSVSVVLMVTMSTPWNRLLGALRALGVPKVFVMIVAMAYRYLFVLLGTITDLLLARKARTVEPPGHGAMDRRFAGAALGTILSKSSHLSEEVHQAMVARGYTGAHHSLRPSRVHSADLAVLAGVLAAAIALQGVDHLLR